MDLLDCLYLHCIALNEPHLFILNPGDGKLGVITRFCFIILSGQFQIAELECNSHQAVEGDTPMNSFLTISNSTILMSNQAAFATAVEVALVSVFKKHVFWCSVILLVRGSKFPAAV